MAKLWLSLMILFMITPIPYPRYNYILQHSTIICCSYEICILFASPSPIFGTQTVFKGLIKQKTAPFLGFALSYPSISVTFTVGIELTSRYVQVANLIGNLSSFFSILFLMHLCPPPSFLANITI